MPAFAQNVLDATKETPATGEYSKYNEFLKKRAQAAQEQYGGLGGYRETPQVPMAQQLKAERDYESEEFGRRQQAATQKYGLAQSMDVSRGGIADRVRAALSGRENLKKDVWDQQKRMEQESLMAGKEQALQFSTQMGKMNFASFQTAAERVDAMQQAYAKGILNFQMIDAAKRNMLQMTDIDKYFALQRNNFENILADIKSKGDLNMQSNRDKFQADSNNTGSIISGISDIGAAGAKAYFSKGAS